MKCCFYPFDVIIFNTLKTCPKYLRDVRYQFCSNPPHNTPVQFPTDRYLLFYIIYSAFSLYRVRFCDILRVSGSFGTSCSVSPMKRFKMSNKRPSTPESLVFTSHYAQRAHNKSTKTPPTAALHFTTTARIDSSLSDANDGKR